jgi:hypothetical protein
MAIEVSCRKCGKEYRVREERAGTKIRCKQCEATIAVPLVETEEEWDETPMPPARGGRAKADGKTKDVRKKSGAGSSLGIWLGVVAGLVVLIGLTAVLLKFLPSGAGRSADGAPAAAGANWVKFTLPDGSASALFPGPVKSEMLPNGVMTHKAMFNETGFAMSDKSPTEMTEDFLERNVESPNPFATSEIESTRSLETINGNRCLRTTMSKDGKVIGVNVTYLHNRRLYLVMVVSAAQAPLNVTDVESFLKSVTFH